MIQFKVNPDNADSYEVNATTRDVMQWEKRNKGKSALQFEQGTATLTDLYAIAHIASVRQGLYEGNLNQFEAECDLEFDEEEEDTDPPSQLAA
jgi:hypothetical protein